MNSKSCAFGCGIVAVAFVAFFVGMIGGFVVLMELGYFPSTEAQSHDEIKPPLLKTLENEGIIDPGEQVLYFYSTAFMDASAEGNLFTDRRVISYEVWEGDLAVYEAAYPDIAQITMEKEEDWLGDSTITVTLHDGEWFLLYVSNENRKDEAFYRELMRQWEKERGVEQ